MPVYAPILEKKGKNNKRKNSRSLYKHATGYFTIDISICPVADFLVKDQLVCTHNNTERLHKMGMVGCKPNSIRQLY